MPYNTPVGVCQMLKRGRRGPYKGRALRSVDEEFARSVGVEPILPPQLHLQRAERLIEMELAQVRAERRSPHQPPLRRPRAADHRKIEQALDDLAGMIRRSTAARRVLRGRARWQKVRWENRLWRLVRLLRARLDAFPTPTRLPHRAPARAVSPSEPSGRIGKVRWRRSSAAFPLTSSASITLTSCVITTGLPAEDSHAEALYRLLTPRPNED